jgi:hypothetical protein
MSTTDLYILNGKSTTHIAKFRNGWGSAPMAWDHLAAKYLAKKLSFFDGYSDVWALADDDRLQHHEKVALMMTFDRAFIPIEHLADAAECCRKFGAECNIAERVNHWPAIGDALAAAAQKKHRKHARGVVMSCTSVSDPWLQPDDKWLESAWPIYEEIGQEQNKDGTATSEPSPELGLRGD